MLMTNVGNNPSNAQTTYCILLLVKIDLMPRANESKIVKVRYGEQASARVYAVAHLPLPVQEQQQ